MKIKINPDIHEKNSVLSAIKENEGFCPCKVSKTDDTKCMCKEFRESMEEGYCGCGLYYKVND